MLSLLLALAYLTNQTAVYHYSESHLAIQDLRPTKETKKNGPISSFIFDCEFGVYNISDSGVGDDRVARDRVNGLQSLLELKFGDRLTGHMLQVEHYRLLLNGAAVAKADSVEVAVGKIAPSLASGQTAHAKCTRDKMTAGWFDTSEIKNANSPIIVEFDGKFDGQSFAIRLVRSPNREFSSGVAIVRLHRADTDEFAAAYNETNEKIAEAIALMLK